MSSMDVQERLERVEASLAISQLPARYAMAIDSRDMEALAKLYVDDIDFGRSGQGHDVLKALFSHSTSLFYRSIHQIVGHSFELTDATHATGRAYCRAEHERGGSWIVALMCYFDQYEKRDGRWLFAKPRDYDFFYCADTLEHPQDVDFKRWVVPGMNYHPPMMLPRFPEWKNFWELQGEDVVAGLTAHP